MKAGRLLKTGKCAVMYSSIDAGVHCDSSSFLRKNGEISKCVVETW